MSECAERERFGNIGQAEVEGSRVTPGCRWEPVWATSALREGPVRAHRPAGQEIRSPVIPGLVGNRPGE